MSTSTTPQRPTLTPARSAAIVLVLGFGSLVGSIMQSLIIPLQGQLPELLSTNPSNASWAITATLLAAGVAMPVTGRLADMYGRKKVLVACSLILLAASIICALSDSLLPFLIGRALQGIAMGYVPVAISAVRDLAAPEKQASAVAGISATLGVGGALGLPLSAWIVVSYDWHMLFWMASALAVIVAVSTQFFVPSPPKQQRETQRLDVAGVIGLTIGLTSALIGVSKGAAWGWGSALTWGCIVGGIVVLLIWGTYQLRHTDPLVNLRTMANRPVLFTNLAGILFGFGLMAQSIVVPQLLQLPTATGFGLGQTILQAGLWMAPAGLMMLIFSPLSSRLITTIGARVTLVVGAVVTGVGYIFALFLMDAPWQLMIACVITAAGAGIGYAAMPTLILDNVPRSEAGSGIGVNSLMRSLGTTMAGAAMAAVLTSRTLEVSPGVVVPDQSAFMLCFLLGAIASLLGAAVALLARGARPSVAQ